MNITIVGSGCVGLVNGGLTCQSSSTAATSSTAKCPSKGFDYYGIGR